MLLPDTSIFDCCWLSMPLSPSRNPVFLPFRSPLRWPDPDHVTAASTDGRRRRDGRSLPMANWHQVAAVSRCGWLGPLGWPAPGRPFLVASRHPYLPAQPPFFSTRLWQPLPPLCLEECPPAPLRPAPCRAAAHPHLRECRYGPVVRNLQAEYTACGLTHVALGVGD